jgi:hypothetical protein
MLAAKAQAKEEADKRVAQAKEEADRRLEELVVKLKGHLLSMPVGTPVETQVNALDIFWAAAKQEEEPTVTPQNQPGRNKRAAPAALASSNKRARTGDKVITASRAHFQYLDATAKLMFIQEHAGGNPKEYINRDRQWLFRVNPIAKCFIGCCKENVDTFLQKHGQNGKFSVEELVKNKMSGCEECKQQE